MVCGSYSYLYVPHYAEYLDSNLNEAVIDKDINILWQEHHSFPENQLLIFASCESLITFEALYTTFYAGTVKRQNVCKRHLAIDTGFKQTERTIFLRVITMGQKL